MGSDGQGAGKVKDDEEATKARLAGGWRRETVSNTN